MIEGTNTVATAEKWLQELKLAKREDEKWIKRGERIVKRYRDERNDKGTKRYNVLWSNVQTMLPALYAKTPKVQVERRHKDQDPVGRTAAQILERALQFEIDHKNDLDHAVKCAVLDRLLPGRGVAWVRFEAAEETQTMQGAMQYECSPVDYVFWKDFRCNPARTWDEVTWVARRVFMSKDAVIKRFGDEFNDVPLTHEPIGLDDVIKNGENADSLKKAQIWEIWDKETKTVIWVAEGYQKALDVIDDPYGLDSFWPCPKPIYSTQTTDTLVPVPDFSQYQDQAEEIDLLTNRINMLVKAVKVVGVYDATQTGVSRMLNEGVDNVLIPVDKWAAFSEKNGLKGAIDFMPLESVLQALQQCYVSREQCKQVIYEITGMSDIIRGASVASETATAQQIKSQYATLRLRDLQKHVAMFSSELLRIKGQLMADLYSPQALIEMSGIMGTKDAEFVDQAMQLLKSEPLRTYRIEVAADSLVEMDEASEKDDRVQFLTAVGGFLREAIPAAQQVPEMAPLMAEMLLFGVRAFKAGRPMEAAFDTAMAQLSAPKPPPQPQPDPEQIKAQAAMQLEQTKMQANQQLEQGKLQLEEYKFQATQQAEQMRMQADMQAAQQKAELDSYLEQQRMAHEQMLEQSRQEHEARLKQMELDSNAQTENDKAELDASVKILVAQISAQTTTATAQMAAEAANQTVAEELAPDESLTKLTEMHGEMIKGMGDVVKALKAPKKRTGKKLPDGSMEITESVAE